MPYAIATVCPVCGKGECVHKGAPRQRPRNWKTISRRVKAGKSCEQCGARTRLMVDHIVPLSMGGTEDAANLRVLCVTCHNQRLESFGARQRG